MRKRRRTFIARDVVLAAGTMGTQRLLHRMRDEGHLPNLSPRLGELTRTNSEAILGARTFRRDVDFTKGVAITSSFHPDEHTHIEPVRYGKRQQHDGPAHHRARPTAAGAPARSPGCARRCATR